MASHSHVTRLKMLEKTRHKGPQMHTYANQDEASLLSGNSSMGNTKTESYLSATGSVRPNPKTLKSAYSKSHEQLFTGSVLSEEGSRYAPSMRSGLGHRSGSRTSLASMSRSMGASKASLASQKSTIQQEYHDIKVKRKMKAPWFGSARKPFIISIVMYCLSVLFLLIGLLILFLRGFMHIFLKPDTEEVLGPLFIALSIFTLAIGIKFSVDAYRQSARERLLIRYRADDTHMVQATKNTTSRRPEEKLATGTRTDKGLSRQLKSTSLSELRMV